MLLWLGIVTALLAGVMAFLQRHLKRLLAYSVICHIGIMLAGIGLLDATALAGTEMMFLAHALLTAGLFFVAGILHVDHCSIDELRLRGKGGKLLGLAWLGGTLGLIGTPYVGVYLGHGLIDDGAERTRADVGARPPLARLGAERGRAAAHGRWIFLGWGDDGRSAARQADGRGADRPRRRAAAPRRRGRRRRRRRRRDQRRARPRPARRVRGRPFPRPERLRGARPAGRR